MLLKQHPSNHMMINFGRHGMKEGDRKQSTRIGNERQYEQHRIKDRDKNGRSQSSNSNMRGGFNNSFKILDNISS